MGTSADEVSLAIGQRHNYLPDMVLIALFLLGVGNFAVHKAVLESGHPMLDALPSFYRSGGGRFSLMFEFFMLLAAMVLASQAWAGMAWAYGIYSLFNFATAWLILTGRI